MQGLQLQVQGGCRQLGAGQVFGHQALQVGGVLGGLGGAQLQVALGGGVAPGVHGPAQLQQRNAMLAQLQPQLQLFQQALGTKQQGRGVFYRVGQFQLRAEDVGQRKPGVDFGLEAIGAVERTQQVGPKTPHHATARQGF